MGRAVASYLCRMSARIDSPRYDRASLFWVLHSGGWAAYLISQLLGAYLSEKMTGKLLTGVLAKVPGLDVWLPKAAARKAKD